MSTLRLLLVACSMVPLFIGCGGESGISVNGTVTYDGQPLKNGSVTFEPADGAGVGASATIEAGQFTLPAERKLKAGSYNVSVNPGEVVSGTDPKDVSPQFPIWTTKVDLKPDNEPLTFDVPKAK